MLKYAKYISETQIQYPASASFAGYVGGRITIPNYAATCRLAGLRLYDRVLTAAERAKILNEYNA